MQVQQLFRDELKRSLTDLAADEKLFIDQIEDIKTTYREKMLLYSSRLSKWLSEVESGKKGSQKSFDEFDKKEAEVNEYLAKINSILEIEGGQGNGNPVPELPSFFRPEPDPWLKL